MNLERASFLPSIFHLKRRTLLRPTPPLAIQPRRRNICVAQLLLHGGINAVLWDDVEAIEAEIRSVVPAIKESGGYIFSSDHSVPSSISLEQFRYITNLAKKLGSYA